MRWLRAAEQMIADRSRAERVLAGLVGEDADAWSFAENARVAALLDVVRGAETLETEPIRPDVVVYDVFTDAVVARTGATVVATASLEPNGDTTVAGQPGLAAQGHRPGAAGDGGRGRRHAGREEILLLAPGDDEGTLPMVASIGLHPIGQAARRTAPAADRAPHDPSGGAQPAALTGHAPSAKPGSGSTVTTE